MYPSPFIRALKSEFWRSESTNGSSFSPQAIVNDFFWILASYNFFLSLIFLAGTHYRPYTFATPEQSGFTRYDCTYKPTRITCTETYKQTLLHLKSSKDGSFP